MLSNGEKLNDPKGSRTPVLGLKIRCPRPLDDGAVDAGSLRKVSERRKRLRPDLQNFSPGDDCSTDLSAEYGCTHVTH